MKEMMENRGTYEREKILVKLVNLQGPDRIKRLFFTTKIGCTDEIARRIVQL